MFIGNLELVALIAVNFVEELIYLLRLLNLGNGPN